MTHSNSGTTSVTIEDGPTVSTALIAWALLAVTAFIAIASAAAAVAVAVGLARFERASGRAGERASGRAGEPASERAGEPATPPWPDSAPDRASDVTSRSGSRC